MQKVFERPKSLNDRPFHYCPGCGHGIVHRMIAEALDELLLRERTILISPVGCSVFAYWYFETDNVQASHGRAPAVGTGIKRALPDSIVISYQGDGDLASSGMAEIVHAAARGENFTVVFINNAIYGVTRRGSCRTYRHRPPVVARLLDLSSRPRRKRRRAARHEASRPRSASESPGPQVRGCR